MKLFESTFRVWESGSHSYAARLTDSLNEQRKSGSFCDIVVKLNDQCFPAHRGVLCAASGYFQGLLDGNFKEHGATEVDLTDSVDGSETMSAILDYIYTGKLKIEKESFEKLLAGVSFLLLEDACHLIATFLLENLVLENCIDIMVLADRYCLQELSAVTFEILSSRLHDYFIHHGQLVQTPINILSKLAAIQAFNSVTEDDLLAFLKSYLNNYISCNAVERELLGSFGEIQEFFRDTKNDFDHDIIRVVYETCLKNCKAETDINFSELQDLHLSENSDTTEEQEVLSIVSVKLLENDRVALSVHAYYAHSSKWTLFAEINISKRDHRTLKDFIGVYHTGELLFSTEKRVAFVSRNGEVRYASSFCHICVQELDMECKHYYFCFQSNLFAISANIRGMMFMSASQGATQWEMNSLAYNLSTYDDLSRDWININEFSGAGILGKYRSMVDIDFDVTHYPQYIFDIHPQRECTWILATLNEKGLSFDEGKNLEKDGGKLIAKIFKLVHDPERNIFKLIDVKCWSVLENSGARKCLLRSTCDKNKLFVHSLVPTDDPALEPEILYYSGAIYTYDIASNTFEAYPWINTPTKNQELNALRGRSSGECEIANPKVFNVTFNSPIGSPSREYRESGSIAPSHPLPLVEFQQRRKTEHEQLIRGTSSGRHIDTYQKKVYGTLLRRSILLASNRYGSFYQVYTLSPLVTELWQYSLKDLSWQYLPPPPVDTNIMHLNICSLSMDQLPSEQINGQTMKAAGFSYGNKNLEASRPFANYHLKTAHEKLFERK